MIALHAGTIYPVTSEPLKNATILIDKEKIIAVGHHLSLPQDTKIINLNHSLITPGLIDCHTHLGIAEESAGQAHLDKNEVNDPVCPHLRALDGINPEDEGLEDAYSSGITSIIVTPGSENVFGGQSVAIKTYGKVIDKMVLRQPAGIKIALGENPIKKYLSKNRPPSTRMTIAGILRENIIKAQNYQAKLKHGGGERDLRMEALVMVLEGAVPLRAHAHAAEDIMTAIRIADEFKLNLTIEHATSAHKIANELAERDIPAIVGPSITARVKLELKDRTYQTPFILNQAGVKIALATDHPFLPIGSLRLEAGLAIREGLPTATALRAITLNAAEIIGISNRVGSIAAGKDADLAVFSGDPFAIASKIEMVLINGQIVYSAKKRTGHCSSI